MYLPYGSIVYKLQSRAENKKERVGSKNEKRNDIMQRYLYTL